MTVFRPVRTRERRPRPARLAWPGAIAIVVLLASGHGVARAGSPNALVARTSLFAFYSDFDTNVNDALIKAGLDRTRGRTELFQDGDEQACFDGLPGSARKGWDLAVEFYAEIVSPHEWSDRQQYLIRVDLAGVEKVERERDRAYVDQLRGIIGAATPAFAACRWTAQDAANRRWVASLVEQIEAHGKAVTERLAALYRQPLGGLPIRVDVVETVNWSGATTILLDPDGGHILISKAPPGPESLELVFHEASHTLMGRNAPVREVLAQAAEQAGVELPRDLWHGVLFYTTGEAVRRVLAESGEPAYEPMMRAQNIFGKYHEALGRTWPAYMEGRQSLEEAALRLLRAQDAVAKAEAEGP